MDASQAGPNDTPRPTGRPDDPFDLIIIGGGINGAGVARDAARRGLSVVLFEKKDFGTGATGASSGMIHGGLRYLQRDPDVAKLACQDSGYIQKIASHLIFRIPFVVPMIGKSLAKRVLLELAEVYFEAYDKYQPLKRGKQHCRLSAAEAKAMIPGLHSATIGAVTTDEWGIDANRLNLINAIDAAESGAELYTYTEVVKFREHAGKVVGVQVRDRLDRSTSDFFGKIVLNASGAWSSRVFELMGKHRNIVRPGKGIHVVYPGRLTNYAIATAAIDGRDIFICPHQNETWVGTTDDDYCGDLDDVPILEDEVKYLINGIASVLPVISDHRFSRATVGVRPTLYEYGKRESILSREHELFDHGRDGATNLYTLAGGKLASYRIMSEEVTDVICERLGVKASCETHSVPLPGGADHDLTVEPFVELGLEPFAAQRILFRHGDRSGEILDLMREEPRTRGYVCPAEPVTEAELRYVLRSELVRTLDDCQRRCRLGLGAPGGTDAVWRAAQIFAEERGLAPSAIPDIARGFLSNLWETRQGVLAGTQFAQEELGRAWSFLHGKLEAAHTRPLVGATEPPEGSS